MIETIAGLPPGILGFRASGRVSAADYETVLIPAVEAAFGERQRQRLIYQVGPGFEAFEPGAMWDDMLLGMRHFMGWERLAVVTDVAWLRSATSFLAFMIPAQVKVFGEAELEAARDWISA